MCCKMHCLTRDLELCFALQDTVAVLDVSLLHARLLRTLKLGFVSQDSMLCWMICCCMVHNARLTLPSMGLCVTG